MKKFKEFNEEIIDAEVDLDKMFMVTIRGNFWGGKYYEDGLDSIFVKAGSDKEAKEIAKMNIDKVEDHFRNKRYWHGKRAIALKDKHMFKDSDVCKVRPTKQKKHGKCLTKAGIFEAVDLDI